VHVHAVVRIDPKATESFLLEQPDVLDASVWIYGDLLHAHVTVHEDCVCSPRTLRIACAETLGLHQTPAEIQLMCARKRAA
jgi:hypothetical protein